MPDASSDVPFDAPARGGYQYQALRAQVLQWIASGTLRVGDRLPSVRSLRQSRGLHPATVFQAYELLAAEGWVVSKPRSGFFVASRVAWPEGGPAAGAMQPAQASPSPGMMSLPMPQPVVLQDWVFEVMALAKRQELLPLGSPFPDPTLFPLAALARASSRSLRTLTPRSLTSDAVGGHDRLRQQIAQRCVARGMDVQADEVIITHGAIEALMLSLESCTEPGDVVALETPCFPGAIQALSRLRLQAVEVPSHPVTGLDLDLLERVLQAHPVKAVWLMSQAQHPLGASLPEGHRARLVDMARRHGTVLIEDDAYAELLLEGPPATPLRAFDDGQTVLSCGSFSKSLAPGYRLGWVLAGARREALQRLKWRSSLSAAIPAQHALADYLAQGGHDRHLRQLRRQLKARRDALWAALHHEGLGDARMTLPAGGFFLWWPLPGRWQGIPLLHACLRQGLSLMPGELFGQDGRHAGWARLNFGAVDEAGLREAVRLLRQVCAQAPGGVRD